ncbi:putative retrotransposon hot spot protein (RHS) [Trypanosoma cruzi]|uniref:Putative retrotransposon hot spot protein (RHS) n=1 Tax=Trypanosoma cruzi TaxID=5693 RepID=A0A2V2X9R8_TRYCR|nr:putative retrotransposon hot spot protein (RHS) [Trypanosoma cruzi]
MSGRPEEGLYGNLESQSSNVSQGGRRRARSEFESDTDYSSVSRRRLEEMHRPQWTMSSRVEDILLEGSTNRTDMKLNEFLRSKLGGTAAVGENYNVTMEAFVQEPDAYVQDQQLLRRIVNLTAYQTLKIELEKRKILLEAIYKLNHEGVVFLEQWRDYEGKDTVTPFVCGTLNGVLTQVQREERREEEERKRREAEERKRRKEEKRKRREAEERKRREAEERKRREEEERKRREEEERKRREEEKRKRREEEEMEFTNFTTIEDVLFKGGVRVDKMRLNDFLTMELDGRGIVDTNRDVLLKEFFEDPTKYIHDAGVLKEIQASDAYARMERAVRVEIMFENDQSKLRDKGVKNLIGWSEAAAEVKATVHNFTKQSLDAALVELRDPTTTIAPEKLEGLYGSVYNARWSHVVEVPDDNGMGMKVEKGKPKQSWSYREVGDTLERNNGVQKSGEAPPVLMVLTSDKGWPYTLNTMHEAGNDLCVNCEVERVWQIVKGDLTKWFSNFRLTLNPSPMPRVLIGTPGIGKSMNAGSYLLYQLLHYDVEKLQVVVHCFGKMTYVFHKINKTVTKYMGNKISISVISSLWKSGMKGYIIYDVAKKGTPPDKEFAPCNGWGMIVLSSPKVTNYDEWENQLKAARIIMNCPDVMDVKAMCAWMKRDGTADDQAGYWKEVKEHMDNLGPILRYIFDANNFIVRMGAVHDALLAIKPRDVEEHFTLGGEKKWYSKDPSQKLVKIVRVRTEKGAEGFLNAPICADIEFRTAERLEKEMGAKDILLLILGSHGALASKYVEKLGLRAFMYGEFVSALVKELKELEATRT